MPFPKTLKEILPALVAGGISAYNPHAGRAIQGSLSTLLAMREEERRQREWDAEQSARHDQLEEARLARELDEREQNDRMARANREEEIKKADRAQVEKRGATTATNLRDMARIPYGVASPNTMSFVEEAGGVGGMEDLASSAETPPLAVDTLAKVQAIREKIAERKRVGQEAKAAENIPLSRDEVRTIPTTWGSRQFVGADTTRAYHPRSTGAKVGPTFKTVIDGKSVMVQPQYDPDADEWTNTVVGGVPAKPEAQPKMQWKEYDDQETGEKKTAGLMPDGEWYVFQTPEEYFAEHKRVIGKKGGPTAPSATKPTGKPSAGTGTAAGLIAKHGS